MQLDTMVNLHFFQAGQSQSSDQQRAHAHINSQIEEVAKMFIWERGVGLTQACVAGHVP